MNVFFTTSSMSFENHGEETPHYGYSDFYKWTQVCAYSCLKNTNHIPHFIYDGDVNDKYASWFRDKLGIKVYSYRISFYDELIKFTNNKSWLRVATGIYPRVDFPKFLEKFNLDFEKVLMVDTDVMFLNDGGIDNIPVDTIKMCGEHKKDYSGDFNAGVMLMNVEYMRETYSQFMDHLRKVRGKVPGFDQHAYNQFYKNKIQKLPISYNWKPYWGGSVQDANIVHFHGPKPTDLDMMKNGRTPRARKYKALFNVCRTQIKDYENWVRKWETIYEQMIKEIGV